MPLIRWCLLLPCWLLACQSASTQPETTEAPVLSDTSTVDMTNRSVSPPEPEGFDTVAVKYLLGQFHQEKDSLFVRIEDRYSAGSARGAYLRREAYEAFTRMWTAAKDSGITLTIRSATRNFWYQKGIWERKWTGARKVDGQDLSRAVPDPVERARTILRYSSMPGTSRHHWGTDIDLNSFENSYFASGKGLAEYQWLQAHAAAYGFCQMYSEKGEARPNGYEEEKWHWSYLPLAEQYLRSYNALIDHSMIKGFKGDEAVAPLDVITHYVNGLNPACASQGILNENATSGNE